MVSRHESCSVHDCKTISSSQRNICVVGDDAQVYAFRGANIQNILNFKSIIQTSRPINLNRAIDLQKQW